MMYKINIIKHYKYKQAWLDWLKYRKPIPNHISPLKINNLIASKSWNHKTRKYMGLYRNNNIDIQSKINMLKNLKNFKSKSEDEIKRYIQDQEQKSQAIRYRTKYYTRSYNRWRVKHRRSKKLTDQLDDFLQVFRAKSKV